jgi:hypothetical protein
MRRQLASVVRGVKFGLQPISRRLLFNLSPVAVTPVSVQGGPVHKAGTPSEVAVFCSRICPVLARGHRSPSPVTATVSNAKLMRVAPMACRSSGTDCARVHRAAKLASRAPANHERLGSRLPSHFWFAFKTQETASVSPTGAGLPSNFHYDFHGSRYADDGNLPLMRRECPLWAR